MRRLRDFISFFDFPIPICISLFIALVSVIELGCFESCGLCGEAEETNQEAGDFLAKELEIKLKLEEASWTPSWVKAQRKTEIPSTEVLPTEVLSKEAQISQVLIPYRPDGGGKGAFYDHSTLQRLTQHPTAFDPTEEEFQEFVEFAYGADLRIPSREYLHPEQHGLLVIPGRVREAEADVQQTAREQEWIRKARRRGQPILALCAGCWQLWEAYGGKCKEVRDHCYGGGMLRLGADGRTTYNVQIHGVRINRDSLLEGTITGGRGARQGDLVLMVNSVHWKAADAEDAPASLSVSASAVRLGDIHIHTRQGHPMKPELATVEAFESRWGAPVFGIQWHPEGYNVDDDDKHKEKDSKFFRPLEQIQILCYLVQAGDAYCLKRRMLRDLNRLVERVN